MAYYTQEWEHFASKKLSIFSIKSLVLFRIHANNEKKQSQRKIFRRNIWNAIRKLTLEDTMEQEENAADLRSTNTREFPASTRTFVDGRYFRGSLFELWLCLWTPDIKGSFCSSRENEPQYPTRLRIARFLFFLGVYDRGKGEKLHNFKISSALKETQPRGNM